MISQLQKNSAILTKPYSRMKSKKAAKHQEQAAPPLAPPVLNTLLPGHWSSPP
jgi:flagellar motility protein MotE (MotC chaperone)